MKTNHAINEAILKLISIKADKEMAPTDDKNINLGR